MNKTETPFLYFIKIIKAIDVYNLPYPLQNSKRLKITSAKYKTASDNGDLLMIKINGYNENCYYDNANRILERCVKILPLPPDAGSDMIFENQYIDSPDVVLINKIQEGLTSLRIEIYSPTNGRFGLLNDITELNPMYLELRIY
jgi:hypothetical protein